MFEMTQLIDTHKFTAAEHQELTRLHEDLVVDNCTLLWWSFPFMTLFKRYAMEETRVNFAEVLS